MQSALAMRTVPAPWPLQMLTSWPGCAAQVTGHDVQPGLPRPRAELI